MPTTTTNRVTLSQFEPSQTRLSADLQASAAGVKVGDARIKLHEVVVAGGGNHVPVKWAEAPGRDRRRTFSAKTVFLLGYDHRRDENPAPLEKLPAIRPAVR